MRERLLLLHSNRCEKFCDSWKSGNAWDRETAAHSTLPRWFPLLRWLSKSCFCWTAFPLLRHFCRAGNAVSFWAKGTFPKATLEKQTCFFGNHLETAHFWIIQACIKIVREKIFNHFIFLSEQSDSQELSGFGGEGRKKIWDFQS